MHWGGGQQENLKVYILNNKKIISMDFNGGELKLKVRKKLLHCLVYRVLYHIPY